jgi:hypothetical protein
MKDNYFTLTLPSGKSRQLTLGWLFLAWSSLVIGGIFTILIVLSRTPFFQEIIPWIDFFHTALVVHVDLTVLVWFLACAGVFWSLNDSSSCEPCGWLAWGLSVLGTLIITVSPFLGAGSPLMNNYVPVLQSPLFLIGLGIFGLGMTVLVLRGLFFSSPFGSESRDGEGVALQFGIFTALITTLMAIVAQGGSYLNLPEGVSGQYYYELLFWGSGHVLQFTHTQLMLVAWLWLAAVSKAKLRLSPRVAMILFALGMAPTLVTPLIYAVYEVGSAGHQLAFTWLMQYGNGVAALPLGIIVILGVLEGKRSAELSSADRVQRSALVYSLLLFGAGGVIGFLIVGSNVTVPAHYHGSIVAVTIAFMGVIYHLIPRLGFGEISGKWVEWQPAVYGIGQLLHVLGLAWSGGYGVQRKMAGSAQGLEGFQQVAGMGLMGLGGMIAIMGGIWFLVVVFLAVVKEKGEGRMENGE